MSERIYNVLFLCTGNSARSIMAERLMEHWGKGRFRGFSAGSHPTGDVNPRALKLLQKVNMGTEGLRSKSWDEFARADAPVMDFVFTVCDQAASEVCPVWPGRPVSAHWGVLDPAAVDAAEADKQRAFRDSFRVLENRIKIFASLPIAKLDRLTLTQKVREIGAITDAPATTEGV